MKTPSGEVRRAQRARASVKAARTAAGNTRSQVKGGTAKPGVKSRDGTVTGKRTIDRRTGKVTRTGGMSNPNTPGDNRLRAEATGRRIKRNAAADRTATRKAAAANAAKSAARKSVAKAVARRVPAVGLAMTAIDAAGALGGPGGKPAGRRVRKNGVSTRKK